MGKYIHEYTTETDLNSSYSSGSYREPFVGYADDTEKIRYNFMGDRGYVDLGLPSGTLWATCNVGASSPEEYGYYLAWGELTDKNTDRYTWANYIWGSGNSRLKYTNSDGYIQLLLEDDAANYHMGDDWHIPTKEQIQELLDYTTQVNASYKGVAGRYFVSTINGKMIFIPFAGGKWYDNDGGYGTNLYIWSSTLRTDNKDFAWCTSNSSGQSVLVNSFTRRDGLSVRGVKGYIHQ